MRRRSIVVLGVIATLALLLVGSGAAMDAGWRPDAPPRLPLVTYAPLPEPGDHTLANATLDVGSTTFVVDVVGRGASGDMYEYRLRVHRVAGEGDLVTPVEATVTSPDLGTSKERFHTPDDWSVSNDGVLVAGLRWVASTTATSVHDFEIDLVLTTYDDLGRLGAWETGDTAVSMAFTLDYTDV